MISSGVERRVSAEITKRNESKQLKIGVSDPRVLHPSTALRHCWQRLLGGIRPASHPSIFLI
jgi:hypothetical protein